MSEWMDQYFSPESIRQRAKDHEEGNTWTHHLAYDNAFNSPTHYYLAALVECDRVCIDPTNEWWDRRGEVPKLSPEEHNERVAFLLESGWLVKDSEGKLHPGPMLKEYEEEERRSFKPGPSA